MAIATNVDIYGEVFTPIELVNEMYETISKHVNVDEIRNILEPGAGEGIFYRGYINSKLKDVDKYTMVEINDEHEEKLVELDIPEDNNNLSLEIIINSIFDETNLGNDYDLVIGNLPFNNNGRKPTPSIHTSIENDHPLENYSEAIWCRIVKHVFNENLREGGYFSCIIPCIWLKPDKAGIYEMFTKENRIIYIKTYSCAEANRIFRSKCQTPICYVIIKKEKIGLNEEQVFCLENPEEKVKYFRLKEGYCIPTRHIELFLSPPLASIYNRVEKVCCLSKRVRDGLIVEVPNINLETYELGDGEKKVITGSNYNSRDKILELKGFISTEEGKYLGVPKIILPHKRLAKFIRDPEGEYSLYGRDMYIIRCNNEEEMDELYDRLTETNSIKIIEEGFKIRMNFIERDVFRYI